MIIKHFSAQFIEPLTNIIKFLFSLAEI